MTPEEANAILAKRFGITIGQQPNVVQPGMYVRSPQSQPSIFPNSQPQPSKAEQLLQAARERLGNAGAAARMKMREQEEQGVRSYVPDDKYAADSELMTRLLDSNLPMPEGNKLDPYPTQLQQRPTGGVIASYGPNERVVTSLKGAGSLVVPTGPRKPATFDGKSKAQFFGQAAARQGQDNLFARAEKTGAVDALGRPQFASIAIPKGNTATSERIFEAIRKGSPMPPRQTDEYDARKANEALWKERLAS
jgi:hypothetical protein